MIGILSGMGLIIFGIRFLRKGLDRLFGGRLLQWLAGLTAHPLKSFGVGAAAGVVSPSSTSLSIMAVQLLNDGRLRTEGVLAMLLGANIGMTALVQLMTLRVQDFSGVLVAVGVAGFVYIRREVLRGIAQCLLAFGFIFMGMTFISSGAVGIAASAEMQQMLELLHGHSVIIFLGTMFLAIILQSSTATIGLGVGLCVSGMFGVAELVSWVLGTNAGVGVSSLIVGWRAIVTRRLGVANLFTKLCIALPLLFIPWLGARCFSFMPGDAEHQIVMFHTAFNVVVGIISLPLLGVVMRVAGLIVPEPNAYSVEDDGPVCHLDPKALDTPSVALARATRETLLMADRVRDQLTGFWLALHRGDVELARQIQKEDDRVDRYNRDLIAYLSHIGGEMNARDTRLQMALMNFSVELEAVGDLLEKHLCDLVIKQRADGVALSPYQLRELEGVYELLLHRFDEAVSLFTANGDEHAVSFVSGKHTFNEHCHALQQSCFSRLRSGDIGICGDSGGLNASLRSGYFLDYLSGLRRINSHLGSMAYALIASSKRYDSVG